MMSKATCLTAGLLLSTRQRAKVSGAHSLSSKRLTGTLRTEPSAFLVVRVRVGQQQHHTNVAALRGVYNLH